MSPCKSCGDFAADDARGTLEKLYKAAENGCICCNAVQQAVRQLLPEASSPDLEYILWTTERRQRTDMLHPEDSSQWELNVRIEKEPFIIEHDILIHAVPELPSPWKSVPLFDDLPTSTDSDKSSAFALGALKECLDNHSLCENAPDGFLPSRLVEVQETSVRVVDTHELDPAQTKYLALSHCWGPPESITAQLNNETYEEYTKEIPAAALPKTFKDAIAITRKLGYRYIWIDSLCIIQHNVECWIKEGSQMCQIYENSHVTLAAASSPSGQGGLFYNSPKIEIAGTIPESGQKYRLFARFNFNHRFFDYPLMNRAWVMQERLLSPRTLYFTSQELVWECRSRNVCQCSPILGGFQAQVYGFPDNSKLQPAEAHLDTSALVSKWYEVVEIYTQLKLSHPGDKLMAIDGIAQYMAPMRESQHFAGLWADSFVPDLAWATDPFDEEKSRAPEWRAPTWSWASLETKIIWYAKETPSAPEAHFSVEKWPQHGEGIQPWTESCEDSRIVLSGILVKTTVAEADMVVNSSPCLYQDFAEWVPSGDNTQDDEPLYCLRLLEAEDLLCSLVLRKSESQGQTLYQRHGLLLFQANPKNENEIWNTRDKPRSRWDRVKPRAGFPSWWVGGDLTSVTII
ncbi:hypothetical protein MRS44_016594 [Fusarium solani]|uniref:Heterokaryon incompatibility protein-domain-containing protein n=1 Tax=Fusarium solani TaxID=169388 RepID=A0A9P9K9W9_FUSSL|nr:heterokaryon incompatibility protein-domain-containing protein [Fusarium solani]KAH7254742.1 heterokaryon incompatibility protein-domain-containing protein [Fusarium solani]KAJ3456571.1 hypothetical protein MRS44_016594 [Fusarium solani]